MCFDCVVYVCIGKYGLYGYFCFVDEMGGVVYFFCICDGVWCDVGVGGVGGWCWGFRGGRCCIGGGYVGVVCGVDLYFMYVVGM